MERIALYPGSFDPVTNGHIDVLSQALDVADRVIATTHSVRYGGRTLTPAGEEISGVHFDGTNKMHQTPIREMLEHYERFDPSLAPKNDAFLTTNGMTRDTVVNWNFDIVLDLQPVGDTVPPKAVVPVAVGPSTRGDDNQ